MIEFIFGVTLSVTVLLVIVLVMVYHQEQDADEAFPMTSKREKARMMREEWERE